MLDPRDVRVEAWRDAAVRVTQAVRLTHTPTGIAVECGEHPSQVANRDAAMAELERRVADATAARRRPRVAQARSSETQTGSRPRK
jgi:protein subunit release factor A